MIPFFRELQESSSLRTAIAASLLWHLVWLFVIYIDVEGPGVRPRLEPKIYFVGPVLSDDAFNLILAEKPEFSTTVYRPTGQTVPTLEPQQQTMERPEPGDLVSIPLGQATWVSLRGQMKEEKPYPETLFRKKLQATVVQKPFPIEGALASRELVSLPVFPATADAGGDLKTGPEFELTVSAAGRIQEVVLVHSSGDPEADRIFERYLRQWQFAPQDGVDPEAVQKGRVRIPQ